MPMYRGRESVGTHPGVDPVAEGRQGVAGDRPNCRRFACGHRRSRGRASRPARSTGGRPLPAGRPVVQVVGEDLRAVADDHLVAQHDRVVGQQAVLGERTESSPSRRGAVGIPGSRRARSDPSVDRHWSEPTSIGPATTLVRVGEPANVGQRPSGWAGGARWSAASASATIVAYGPFRPASVPGAPGKRLAKASSSAGAAAGSPAAARQRSFLAATRPGRRSGRDGPGRTCPRGGRARAGGTPRGPRRTGRPGTPGRRAARARRRPTSCRTPARPPAAAAPGRAAAPPGDTTARPGRRPDSGRSPGPRAAVWPRAALAELPEVDEQDEFIARGRRPPSSLGSLATLSPYCSITR